MAKVTISQAVGLTGVSESTIRRDIKSGKVSSEKDAKGHRRIDTAELQRVYHLTEPHDSQKTAHDSQKVITVLENQVADLQAQLKLSNQRETALIDEKSKLLELLTAEKAEKRALMPPPEEKQGHRKSPNWLRRLIGVS
ncbi:MAG: hypothetical protein V6Z82_04275 [Flavobacteriales bacterium]